MKRALVSFLLVASCGSAATPEAFLSSAVGIEANGCSLVASLGSGAILDEDRVVTSAHTVAGANEIDVIDSRGRALAAILVGFDPESDLAVLSVPGLEGDPLRLGEASGGESGWVLAWNRDQSVHAEPMTVTKRIVVTIEDIYVEDLVERRAIELKADISNGDSGSAVITDSGEVVGIVYATSRSRNVGFALDEHEIAAALASAGTDAVDPGPCT